MEVLPDSQPHTITPVFSPKNLSGSQESYIVREPAGRPKPSCMAKSGRESLDLLKKVGCWGRWSGLSEAQWELERMKQSVDGAADGNGSKGRANSSEKWWVQLYWWPRNPSSLPRSNCVAWVDFPKCLGDMFLCQWHHRSEATALSRCTPLGEWHHLWPKLWKPFALIKNIMVYSIPLKRCFNTD